MIPVEIGEPSLYRELYHPTQNHQNMALHLDLLPELKEKAQIRNLAAKQRAVKKYNANLSPRSFVIGDLVLRMASNARKKDGKFSANWDDPYCIREDAGGGAYRLEQLSGEEIPNTWNVSHLKFYFSSMCIVIEPILVTPSVLSFLTWTFFPKEGFGQGSFNEAPLFNK